MIMTTKQIVYVAMDEILVDFELRRYLDWEAVLDQLLDGQGS